MKIRPVSAELLHADRPTDGRTDRRDEDRRSFRNFANAPKNDYRSSRPENERHCSYFLFISSQQLCAQRQLRSHLRTSVCEQASVLSTTIGRRVSRQPFTQWHNHTEVQGNITTTDLHFNTLIKSRPNTQMYLPNIDPKQQHSQKQDGSNLKVCKSVHYHTFKINRPTRCNFSNLLLDVYSYVQLNMFRASSRPSSGAQQL
jgi:hypothetical protein